MGKKNVKFMRQPWRDVIRHDEGAPQTVCKYKTSDRLLEAMHIPVEGL
jgi:hypothetical protein